MKNGEIIGFSRFVDKKGVDRLFVDVVSALTDFDKQHGRFGMKSEQIWIPSSCYGMFNESVIGKVLKCEYEVSGRYVNVIGCQIV